jgi:hypothetical protein
MQRNSKIFRGTWRRMSYRPTIQTVGKAEIRCQSLRVLAALSACLLCQAHLISCTNGSLSDIVHFSSAFEMDLSPRLDIASVVVLRSQDTGTSHKPLAFASDFLVCEETEDPDPFDEDTGHPQAFAESSLIPVGEFSSYDSARAGYLPFLAMHGLMSRRF